MRNQLHADYYQAKIQIRPYNEKVVRFINNQVKRDKNVFVSKVLVNKGGIDFFVSSNKFARIAGKKLKKSFKGELIESVKLHTRDRVKSKNLYRVTVCFRLSPFEKSAKTPKDI